ncbi:MAG: maleylpyruvate isomerase N-terminal domain-containing protein, partial [Actinobacteria bacterium]|nr:maleylpyruvate isomerase N-terminal domain-containing protein [Actinomycetota bacterium]
TLAAAMDDLPDAAWTATVRSRQGQDIPAADIPWMRAREVYIHAVDLGGSTTFADFPADVTTALVVDVAGRRAAGGDGPGLAAWLTGRAAAPTLGAWL